jgi:hypothetical protein
VVVHNQRELNQKEWQHHHAQDQVLVVEDKAQDTVA